MKSLLVLSVVFALLVFAASWIVRRLHRRLGIAILVGALSGILVWTAVGDGTSEVAQMSVLAGLAVFVSTYLLQRGSSRSPALKRALASKSKEPEASVRPRSWLPTFLTRVPRSHAFDTAWTMLAVEAPWAASRLTIARRGCDRFRAKLEESKLDPEAHDRLIFMQKRIPQFVGDQLREAAISSAPERDAILEDLVELLERYAADCERRCREQIGSADIRRTALRARIEDYLGSETALRL